MTYIQETDHGNPFFRGHSDKSELTSTLESDDYGKLVNIVADMNNVGLTVDASDTGLKERFEGKVFYVRLLDCALGNEAWIEPVGFKNTMPIELETVNDVLSIYWDNSDPVTPELFIV
jgi:hypothetical protein